jgi:hypothetical protein
MSGYAGILPAGFRSCLLSLAPSSRQDVRVRRSPACRLPALLVIARAIKQAGCLGTQESCLPASGPAYYRSRHQAGRMPAYPGVPPPGLVLPTIASAIKQAGCLRSQELNKAATRRYDAARYAGNS